MSSGVPSRRYGKSLMLGTVAAIAFIGYFEGGKRDDGSSVAYADKLAQGLPTVCGGLTRHSTSLPIVVGELWPAQKCRAEEQKAVIKYQLALEKCFATRPPQTVFDAATSHAWNNGVPATCNSSAMRAWRAGEWAVGCRRLAYADSGKRVWSYVKTGTAVDGKPKYRFVQGLANRRDAEYRLCSAVKFV